VSILLGIHAADHIGIGECHIELLFPLPLKSDVWTPARGRTGQ
jgi:hypothetical protein